MRLHAGASSFAARGNRGGVGAVATARTTTQLFARTRAISVLNTRINVAWLADDSSDPSVLSLQRPLCGQAYQSVVGRIRGAHVPLPAMRSSSGDRRRKLRSDGQPRQSTDVALTRARAPRESGAIFRVRIRNGVARRLAALDHDVVALVTTKHRGGPLQEMPDDAEMNHLGPALFADADDLGRGFKI
uniref:Uncharacterized protein n=1 Tax=Rhodopseudomonas palustris (strain BisA53) TaxID=316055 RepID=Q07N35_RHOP5